MGRSSGVIITVKVPIKWDVMTDRQKTRLSRITIGLLFHSSLHLERVDYVRPCGNQRFKVPTISITSNVTRLTEILADTGQAYITDGVDQRCAEYFH